MTDPLLTIDDATREFRVSPKTIRRRLVAGEIDGAYKRPGARGPEWVMPRGALEAAGFVHRAGATAVELPADPEAQVGYWEQRALDAEAALEVARQGSSASGASPHRRRGRAWLAAGALLLLGLVAGLLVAGRGDDPSPTELEPSHVASQATLSALTGADDAIGVVGRVPETLLPDDRRYVLVEADSLRPDDPQFLVAVVDGEPVRGWSALRDGAETVATVPVPEGMVELIDRGVAAERAATTDEGAGDRDAETAAPTTAPAPDGPDTAEPPAVPSAGDEAIDDAAADQPPPASSERAEEAPAGVPAPASVEVTPGDSFWSVAEGLAGGEGEPASTVEVTAVWAALIDANADRLVEPGNPDLLHVGQVLVVPSLPR